MLPPVVPRLATDSAVRVFPGVWKLLSFLRLPSWDRAPSLPLLSLFLPFMFFPTSFQKQWAAFLGAWCPLLAFRSCFVEFTQGVNVLLMNLWGRKWSPHPIPPPSLRNLFPSLSEFSIVYCDPHSQRLWNSQESRNRCFSGTLLLFRYDLKILY